MDSRTGCITWSGVASCGVSVILYVLSRYEAGRLHQLERAVTLPTLGGKVIENPDLRMSAIAAAELASDVLPMVVALRGRAATDRPVYSELTSKASVIAEIMEELSSKRKDERGEWTSEDRLMGKQRYEAAWYLTDDSCSRIDVRGSMHAELLRETFQIAKEFRAGQRSMCNRIIDRLSGIQMLGVRRTERCLPVGTPLTVVGQLSRVENGDAAQFVIDRPESGLPFYITNKTMGELQSSVKKAARAHAWLSVGFGAVGIALLGSRTWRQVKSAMRYRHIRKQLEKDVRSKAEIKRPKSIPSNSPRTDTDEHCCIVCLDRPANAAFIPCGHNCVCRRCGMELNRCPVCRKRCEVYRIYPI